MIDNSVIITPRPQDIGITVSASQGDVEVITLTDSITVQIGATVTTSSGSFVIGETPTGAINGSNATFTTLHNFVPETVQVFINGVSQTEGVDYTTSGSTVINLSVSPIVGDYIRVNYKLG